MVEYPKKETAQPPQSESIIKTESEYYRNRARNMQSETTVEYTFLNLDSGIPTFRGQGVFATSRGKIFIDIPGRSAYKIGDSIAGVGCYTIRPNDIHSEIDFNSLTRLLCGTIAYRPYYGDGYRYFIQDSEANTATIEALYNKYPSTQVDDESTRRLVALMYFLTSDMKAKHFTKRGRRLLRTLKASIINAYNNGLSEDKHVERA